jgi:hypothetical protein
MKVAFILPKVSQKYLVEVAFAELSLGYKINSSVERFYCLLAS